MYDKNLAKKFIKDEYPTDENTRKIITFTFNKLSKLEKDYNKNLFEFNFDEAEDTLRYLNCTTTNALAKELVFIQNYEKWALSKGIISNSWTSFSKFQRDDLRKYLDLDTLRDQYIKNREEFFKLCSMLVNAQDKAMLDLAYEGLSGERMGEIRTVERDRLKDGKIVNGDVDFENRRIKVHVIDYKMKSEIIKGKKVETEYSEKQGTRYIDDIDERSLEILRDAMKDVPYINSNGNPKEGTKAPLRYLIDSPYILRPTKRNSPTSIKSDESELSISSNSITTRLNKIKGWINKDKINITTIHRSGMFDRLDRISKEENRPVNTNDCRIVLEMYGTDPNQYGMLKENYEDYKWAMSLVEGK